MAGTCFLIFSLVFQLTLQVHAIYPHINTSNDCINCFTLLFQAITPPTRPPITTSSETLTTKANAGVGDLGEQEGDMRGTFPADFVTTAQSPSDFTSNTMEASQPEPVASAGAGETNSKYYTPYIFCGQSQLPLISCIF